MSPNCRACAVRRLAPTYDPLSRRPLPAASTVSAVGQAARPWEAVFNTIRPHQALEYQTPAKWLQAWLLVLNEWMIAYQFELNAKLQSTVREPKSSSHYS